MDEINAKIVWIRQGGGARDIVGNRREGQAGEEVGVSILLSPSIWDGNYRPREISFSVGCAVRCLLSCRFVGGTHGQ